MAKKISDLTPATELGDNDSFVFNDVAAGNDKRVTAGNLLDALGGAVVSVKRFGVVGDGVADDTTAIQNAVNSSDSLFFPTGTYLISGQINISSNISIFGDGENSLIKRNSSFPTLWTASYFSIDSVSGGLVSGLSFKDEFPSIGTRSVRNMIEIKNSTNVVCCNLSLEGEFGAVDWEEEGQMKPRPTTFNGIEINNSSFCKVVECHVKNGVRLGYRIQDNCFYNTISLSSGKNLHRGAMIITDYDTYDPTFTNYKNDTTTESVLYDSGGSHHNTISHCQFDECLTFGVKIERGSWYNDVSHNHFINCCEYANDSGGVIITGGWYNRIESNTLKNPDFKANATTCGCITILGEDSKDVFLRNNVISDAPQTGIFQGSYPDLTFTVQNVFIENNSIYNVTDGIETRVINGLYISGGKIEKTSGAGLLLNNVSTNIDIGFLVIKNAGTHGLIGQDVGNHSWSIHDCKILNISLNGLRIGADRNVSIANNRITDVNTENDNRRNIQISGVKNLSILGNYMYNENSDVDTNMWLRSMDNLLVKNNFIDVSIDTSSSTNVISVDNVIVA